jgi:cobalt-zinc-cadmium efflux system protein
MCTARPQALKLSNFQTIELSGFFLQLNCRSRGLSLFFMGAGHDHSQHARDHHDHGHGHHHHAAGNIAVAFFLNLGFAIIELIGGFLTNSVAILSDALHDFGDCLSLGTAWYFERKSKQQRSGSFTYGYQRFSLVGALVNAIVLLIGSVFIIRESIERIFQPQQAEAKGMIALAVLGIGVNLVAMIRLRRGSGINERMVSLHFLEDVLGWVAVLIGAIVMLFVDVPVLDPILSLLIACFVLFNVYRNIRPALAIILQGAPTNIAEEDIRELLMQEPEIAGIHDYHIWTLDGTHHVLTMHVVVKDNVDLKEAEVIKERIKASLKQLDVSHATIEIEFDPQHCNTVRVHGP